MPLMCVTISLQEQIETSFYSWRQEWRENENGIYKGNASGKAVLFDHSRFLHLITYNYVSYKFHIGILGPLAVYGCKLLKGD